MGSQSESLQVGVIGAGIAGLSACIALRRAGHDVELFEKSSFRSEIGAALTVTPNGTRVLDGWGFDFDKARDNVKEQNRRVNPVTMEVVAHDTFYDIPKLYGHRFTAFHRVDLHNTMREMAEADDLPGKVDFRLGVDVAGIDCEHGVVSLRDGSKYSKDLIVVADGIKSSFIKDINGVEIPRLFTGMSVHRTLIDMEKLLQNEETRPYLENQASGFFNTVDPKTGVMVVTYPCRSNKVLNIAVFHRSRESDQEGDDWNAQADVEDVASWVANFHPFWKALVRSAGPNDWKCFPVSKRDPLQQVVRGKAVVIGDAAHAMLPTHAQGGSMGIEDSAALEVLLRGAHHGDDISKELKIFQQLRLPRFAVVQLLSNAMMYHRDGDEAAKLIRQYYQGDVPLKAESWSRPLTSFLYGYDIYAQAEIAAKYIDSAGGVPDGVLQYFGKIEERTVS